MKISTTALEILKDHKQGRNILAVTLDRSGETIRRYIRENHPSLTTAVALDDIEKITGLTRRQILVK